MHLCTGDCFIQLPFRSLLENPNPIQTLNRECAKWVRSHVVMSASEDLLEKVAPQQWHHWGRLTSSSCPFDVAGWCKAPQPGTERWRKKKKTQENLCFRLQLFASRSPADVVAALGSGWCHFLPCRGIISRLNAYRALPGVISLWVVSFAAHSICNITLGLFRGCLCACARARKKKKNLLCFGLALQLASVNAAADSCVMNSRGTILLGAHTGRRGTDCHPTGWYERAQKHNTQAHTHACSSVCYFLISCCSVLKPLHPPCRE